jgi:hypothetical protein
MPAHEPPLTRIGTLKNLPDGYGLSVADNESTTHGKANASYPGLGCNKTEPSSIVHVRLPLGQPAGLPDSPGTHGVPRGFKVPFID